MTPVDSMNQPNQPKTRKTATMTKNNGFFLFLFRFLKRVHFECAGNLEGQMRTKQKAAINWRNKDEEKKRNNVWKDAAMDFEKSKTQLS